MVVTKQKYRATKPKSLVEKKKNLSTELKYKEKPVIESQFIEKLVSTGKHSRTVKGGRIMSFSALVVVGDGDKRIGYARGRALTAQSAISKATSKAKRRLFEIEFKKETILYPLSIKEGATKVYLQPAAPGTGIVAGESIRSIFDTIGINNVLSKIYGSTNPTNVVRATIKGLRQMRDIGYFARKRGLTYQEMFYGSDQQVTS